MVYNEGNFWNPYFTFFERTITMRQIGINMHAVAGLTDAEYVKTIADLGFSATFTGSRFQDPAYHAALAELFAKYGVTYETLHAPFKHINDMWLDCEGGDQMLAELTSCIDNCVIGGAKIAVVHLSSGLTPPPVTDLGRARYTTLVEYAQKKGVTVAFENQRFLSNIAWAFETFGPEDSVGFCWDCGHESCFTHGREYMPLFGERLICTHIHDNAGNFNEDMHKLPFQEKIDFNRFAAHLNRVGYQGSLMLEVGCDSRFTVNKDPYEYLAEAADAAKKLRTLVDGE